MAKPIRVTGPTIPRIRVTQPATRRLDPAAVASALGAEPCPEHLEGEHGPMTLYALRQEILRRRQSSGGRPGIEGTSFRAKIPLGEDDWRCLESLAAGMSAEGFSPSPGQIGSILLSLALRALASEHQTSNNAGSTAMLGKELASRLKTGNSQ